jgi:hypothetical protein
MKKKNHGRLFSEDSFTFRPYEDNYKPFIDICLKESRKPAEMLRDVVDEWLQTRSSTGPETAVPDLEKAAPENLNEIEAKLDRIAAALQNLAGEFDFVRRRDHGYFLEIVLVAYATRDTLWRYISDSLRGQKPSPESIGAWHNAMEKEWTERTLKLVDRIRETVNKGIDDDKAQSESA